LCTALVSIALCSLAVQPSRAAKALELSEGTCPVTAFIRTCPPDGIIANRDTGLSMWRPAMEFFKALFSSGTFMPHGKFGHRGTPKAAKIAIRVIF
jgi:hypothetical protein